MVRRRWLSPDIAGSIDDARVRKWLSPSLNIAIGESQSVRWTPQDVRGEIGDAASVGSGGGPTPVALADFKNGVYSVNGDSVALGDIVQEDTNDWGSEFDTGDIVPGTGWVLQSDNPSGYGFAFAGDFLTAILSGCTVVLDFSIDAAAASNVTTPAYLPFDIIKNDFSISLSAFAQATTSGANDGPGGFNDTSLPPFVEGANKFAATLSSSKLAISINGSDPVSHDNPLWGAVEWADVDWISPGLVSPPTAAGVCTLRSVTVYTPQVDADLPSLST